MLNILYYKGNDGIYLSTMNSYGNKCAISQNNIINGIEQESTNSRDWKFVRGIDEIKTVTHLSPPSRTLIGYVLTDESFANDNIPLRLSGEDVGRYWNDDDGHYEWKNYLNIYSLYKEEYSYSEPIIVNVEFNAKKLGDINGVLSNPSDYSVSYSTEKFIHSNSELVEKSLASLVHYNDIDKMMTPEFMLHEKPCSIPSNAFYRIIRSFIIENINPRVSTISSNYEFCFSVSKNVSVRPYTVTSEEKKSNGRSYAIPRINTKKIESKSVKIFDMTDDVNRYRDYPILPAISGSSLSDLVDNVKHYLDVLINEINTPVQQCDHCNGTGHIIIPIPLSPDSK